MPARPVWFTVAFRRKMAELTTEQRHEWLRSIARRVAEQGPEVDDILIRELGEVARGCRLDLVEAVTRPLGPFEKRHLEALLEVPRERFVRPEDVARSADDVPLPLDDRGLATISAPHAYLLSYRLLALSPGDRLVELGTGSGYGAALAAFVVATEGQVASVEIDPVLLSWARRNLANERRVRLLEGDAMESARHWRGAQKVVVTFAVDEIPGAWIDALPDAGALVAPVGHADHDQRLVLVVKRGDRVVETVHGAVRYVRNRSGR